MKSNNSYRISVIAAQMIAIPGLLTLGLFLIMSSPIHTYSTYLKTELGANGVMIIYILFNFLSALILGGFVGFIFSKLNKEKPISTKDALIAPLFPVVYAVFFASLAWIFSKGNYNSFWWGIYALKNPVFLIFDAGLAFARLNVIIPVTEISGYLGFIAGSLLYEQISSASVNNKSSRNLKLAYMMIFIFSIAITSIGTRDVINKGIVELKYGKAQIGNELSEYDLFRIAPFKENNGLAKLNNKPSLQILERDDMPRLDGATAAYPVYAAFAEAVYKGLGDYYEVYGKRVYDAFVSSDIYPYNIIKCSKTADAYNGLINKQNDIIFTAEPSNAQLAAVKASGDEFVLTPIGNEAFIFFTNIKNSVNKLTMKQIQDIYSGKITNWKEVGGDNRSILPYQRPEDSGSQTIMQNKVMKGIKMISPTKETYAGGMGEVITSVASYLNAKNAMGYSFMYYSSSMIKNNQIKYIAINDIMPSHETVKSRRYPFTIPLYAVTLKSNTNKNVKRLINWILTDEGQSIVEKTGYVSVK
jgi:phosphate transport system substrate-binding protein